MATVRESGLAVLCVVLLVLTTTSGDVYHDILPSLVSRMDSIRKEVLPVSDHMFGELLYHLGSYYIPVDGEGELCRNHSNFLLESFLNMDIWALKMIDAASKIPPGIMEGHVIDLGSYDQCLGVEAPGALFRGQHCIVTMEVLLPVDLNNPPISIVKSNTGVMLSLCVPSSCTYADVMAHLNTALSSLNTTAVLEENNCSTLIPEPYSVGDWSAMLAFALIVSLVLVGTVYDLNVKKGINPYLRAFSINVNIKQMLSKSVSPAAIPCLNGLRVLGVCWLVLGHRSIAMMMYPSIRLKDISERVSSLWMAPMQNILLDVEIFFYLTGLLVTYGYLRYQQRGKPVSWLNFYLARYLRLTPCLIFVVVLTSTLGSRLADGPFWKRSFGFLKKDCWDNWWSTLLYISNYANPTTVCAPHTWYLSADFQMYAFSPLLLIPLHKKPKWGLRLTALFLALTTGAGLWNVYHLQLRAGGAFTLDGRTFPTSIYDYYVTHVRSASFIIGIAMGFFLFKIKEGFIVLKLSKATLWAGWLASTFLILFSILFVNYFQQPTYTSYNPWIEIPYQVLHRHMFVLGLSWIIIACTVGHGGWVDTCLSWSGLVPLARLSYSAYLLHVFVQLVFTISGRTPLYFSFRVVFYHFFADLTISYLLAAVLYLLVECPFSNVISVAFEEKKKHEAENNEMSTNTISSNGRINPTS